MDNSIVTGMAKRKFTDEMYAEVVAAFQAYITDKEDPIIVGFISTDPTALKYHVRDDDFSAAPYPRLQDLAYLAQKKSEFYMLSKGMNGQSTAMSIFRLKQRIYGYTDRLEQNITSDGEKVQFFNSLPRGKQVEDKPKPKSKK